MLSFIRNSFAWLIVLLLVAGCSGKKDEEKQSKDSIVKEKTDSDVKKDSDSRKGKPDFILTAKEFAEEFKKDRATRKKYENKIVELSGVIEKLDLSGEDDPAPTISLESGGKFSKVLCITVERMPWAKASPGQTVRVRGLCKQAIIPGLVECEILEVSGPPPPSLTAEQLFKECTADLKAAEKKYETKFLRITGEILNITESEFGVPKVVFKTSMAKPELSISFIAYHKPALKTLQKGQQFTALGMVNGAYEDKIYLTDGLPLK
jgi:hypothetical protein